MKRVVYALLLLAFIGCSKQKDPVISGHWTLVESASNGVSTSIAPGGIIAEFTPSGAVVFTGSLQNSGLFDALTSFHRYEMIGDGEVKLTNSDPFMEAIGIFEADGSLSLSFNFSRCPYQEKFIRH